MTPIYDETTRGMPQALAIHSMYALQDYNVLSSDKDKYVSSLTATILRRLPLKSIIHDAAPYNASVKCQVSKSAYR